MDGQGKPRNPRWLGGMDLTLWNGSRRLNFNLSSGAGPQFPVLTPVETDRLSPQHDKRGTWDVGLGRTCDWCCLKRMVPALGLGLSCQQDLNKTGNGSRFAAAVRSRSLGVGPTRPLNHRFGKGPRPARHRNRLDCRPCHPPSHSSSSVFGMLRNRWLPVAQGHGFGGMNYEQVNTYPRNWPSQSPRVPALDQLRCAANLSLV